MRVDTMGFLAPQGQPMEADPSLHLYLDAMHVTAAPPMIKTSDVLINGSEQFPGIAGVRNALEVQPNLTVVTSCEDLNAVKPDETGIILGLQEAPHDADFND